MQASSNSGSRHNSDSTSRKVPSVGPLISSQLVLPRNIMVGDDVKVPIFHGNGSKDAKEHFFLCDVVLTIKQVQNDNLKRDKLITNF